VVGPQVVAPIAGGVLLSRLPAVGRALGGPGSPRRKHMARVSESLLLLVVYSTFCDTFALGVKDSELPPLENTPPIHSF
jgi:hypothetical protein